MKKIEVNESIREKLVGASETTMANLLSLFELATHLEKNSNSLLRKKSQRNYYLQQLNTLDKTLFVNLDALLSDETYDENVLRECFNTASLPDDYDRFGAVINFKDGETEKFSSESKAEIIQTVLLAYKNAHGDWNLKFANKILRKGWVLMTYVIKFTPESLASFQKGLPYSAEYLPITPSKTFKIDQDQVIESNRIAIYYLATMLGELSKDTTKYAMEHHYLKSKHEITILQSHAA